MKNIIDGMLDSIERNPGYAVAYLLGGAATILVAYWCLSGQLGETADMVFRLALLVSAIAFVCRHMSRQTKTEEYTAISAREEIAVSDALFKHRTGQVLSAEDVAALRLRQEGRIS